MTTLPSTFAAFCIYGLIGWTPFEVDESGAVVAEVTSTTEPRGFWFYHFFFFLLFILFIQMFSVELDLFNNWL